MWINQEILQNLLLLSNVGKIERILIFRLSSIGDIILTSALIRCLRNTYPLAQIDFVVKKQFVQLVESNPNISIVYGFDSSKGFSELKRLRTQLVENNYDVFLDIHKNYRSLFFRSAFKNAVVLKYKKNIFKRTLLVSFGINRYKNELPVFRRFVEAAKGIGVEYDGKKTDFFVSDSAINSFSEIANARNFDISIPFAAIMCGASFQNKKWPKEYFRILVEKLIKRNITVVLVGGKSELQDAEFIAAGFSESDIYNFTGAFDLLQTAALLKRATLTVSNDTGMLHLSEALGVPVIGIYGPTVKEFGYFPVLENSRVAEVELPCRPCTKMGANSCPKGHFKCMRNISPDMLYEYCISYFEDVNNKSII